MPKRTAKRKPAKSDHPESFESGDLNEVFRDIIDQSGKTRYEIAKALGITETTLSRPYSSNAGLGWKLLQSVADAVGATVVAKVKR